MKSWEPHERLPIVTVRELFTRFLDITTPPTTILLQYLATTCENDEERTQLNLLASVSIKTIFVLLYNQKVYPIYKLYLYGHKPSTFSCRIQEHTKIGVISTSQRCPKFWNSFLLQDQMLLSWLRSYHHCNRDSIRFHHRLLPIQKKYILPLLSSLIERKVSNTVYLFKFFTVYYRLVL